MKVPRVDGCLAWFLKTVGLYQRDFSWGKLQVSEQQRKQSSGYLLWGYNWHYNSKIIQKGESKLSFELNQTTCSAGTLRLNSMSSCRWRISAVDNQEHAVELRCKKWSFTQGGIFGVHISHSSKNVTEISCGPCNISPNQYSFHVSTGNKCKVTVTFTAPYFQQVRKLL